VPEKIFYLVQKNQKKKKQKQNNALTLGGYKASASSPGAQDHPFWALRSQGMEMGRMEPARPLGPWAGRVAVLAQWPPGPYTRLSITQCHKGQTQGPYPGKNQDRPMVPATHSLSHTHTQKGSKAPGQQRERNK
jgi:hypothetical protein